MSLCVSTDLASQGRLRNFCLCLAMSQQFMVQFPGLQFMVQFPGFTIHWPTFSFPSHMLFFRAVTIAVYHSGRYKQTSKQDNHVVQRKFAFNRQFVWGSVGTPEGISSISGNHWVQCRALLLWILDPESIPSIARNHWIHCLAPFILDLGPSRASDCELLCCSNHPFG